MTLFEGILRDAIRIDPTPLIRPGFEQVTVPEMTPAAAITIKLTATDALNRLADLIREDLGYLPVDGAGDEETDEGTWYEFYITFNDRTVSGVSDGIQVVVRGAAENDNGFTHTIELTRLEQDLVRAHVDSQCRQHVAIRQGITDLLRASKNRMPV